MKNFNDFLNESISKRFQYSIDKDNFENFKKELKEKSNEYGVGVDTSIINGVKQVKILFRFKGDEKNIKELISWIESFNSLIENKDHKPPWLD